MRLISADDEIGSGLQTHSAGGLVQVSYFRIS